LADLLVSIRAALKDYMKAVEKVELLELRSVETKDEYSVFLKVSSMEPLMVVQLVV